MFRSRWLVCVCIVALTVALWPSTAEAQWRHRRPATVVFVGAYSHPAFFAPYYWGPGGYWGPWGWHARAYPPPYYWRGYDPSGAVRLLVTPVDAEVFVDGYYAGTVNDFNGVFQRLRLPPGEHEIQVYHPSYRTYRMKVLVRTGATMRLQHEMEPLDPGEAPEPRPVASPRARVERPQPGAYPERAPRGAPVPARRPPAERSAFGTLSLLVQPEDAVIVVNGEEWDLPGGGARFVLDLAEGEHRLEVRREGYVPYETTLRIRRGETEVINVSLPRR